MRISDWSSDVCSSDLHSSIRRLRRHGCKVGVDRSRRPRLYEAKGKGITLAVPVEIDRHYLGKLLVHDFRKHDLAAVTPVRVDGRKLHHRVSEVAARLIETLLDIVDGVAGAGSNGRGLYLARSEEHTSELQSLMRISYAVFCLK